MFDTLLYCVLFAGFKAKLLKLAAQKDCGALSEWIRSITNHMYWCASSTQDGNGKVMVAKWVSLMNHIMDIHEHSDENFAKCLHPPASAEDPQTKWLKPRE